MPFFLAVSAVAPTYWSAHRRPIPACVSGKLSPHFSSPPASTSAPASRCSTPLRCPPRRLQPLPIHLSGLPRKTNSCRSVGRSTQQALRPTHELINLFPPCRRSGEMASKEIFPGDTRNSCSRPLLRSQARRQAHHTTRYMPLHLSQSSSVAMTRSSPDQQHAPHSRVPLIVIPICHLRNVNKKKFNHTPALTTIHHGPTCHHL
ncbi:hypothetical protein IWZ01DRAFT_488599 [Phyllosticta capitalensis]